jgi:hypothetical protein
VRRDALPRFGRGAPGSGARGIGVARSLRIVCGAWPLLACVAVAGCGVTGMPRAADDDVTIRAGWYKSVIRTGRESLAAGTRFRSDEKGELVGSYFYFVEGKPERGTLEQCQAAPPSMLFCTWRDRYRSGPFEARFSADSTRFDAYWNTAGKPAQLDWIGFRIDCTPAQQAATLETLTPTGDGVAKVCTLD